MNCEQIESKLVPYLMKDLPDAEQEAVQQHLDACESCRASVRELEQTLELLGGALAAPFEVPEALDETRRAAIYAKPQERPNKKKVVFFHPAMQWAAVLTLLLVGAALLVPSMYMGGADRQAVVDRSPESIEMAKQEEEAARAFSTEIPPRVDLELGELEGFKQELDEISVKPADTFGLADMAESPFDAEEVMISEDPFVSSEDLADLEILEEDNAVVLKNVFAGRSKLSRRSSIKGYGGRAQPKTESNSRNEREEGDDLGGMKIGRELASAKSPVEGRYKEVLGFGEADEEFRDGLAKADAPDVTFTTSDKYYYEDKAAAAPAEEPLPKSRPVSGPAPASPATPATKAPAPVFDYDSSSIELAKNNESLAFDNKGREAQSGLKASEKKKVAPGASMSHARDEGLDSTAARGPARRMAERVSGERAGKGRSLEKLVASKSAVGAGGVVAKTSPQADDAHRADRNLTGAERVGSTVPKPPSMPKRALEKQVELSVNDTVVVTQKGGAQSTIVKDKELKDKQIDLSQLYKRDAVGSGKDLGLPSLQPAQDKNRRFSNREREVASREIIQRQQVAAAKESGAERVVTETEDLRARLEESAREDKNGIQLAEADDSEAVGGPILGDVVVSGQLLDRGNKEVGQDPDGDVREEIAKPVFQAYSFNSYVETKENAFSTFAIDVDTAAYTLARGYMMNGSLPPPDAVRTEEFLNFFNYNYPAPKFGTFAVYTEAAPTPLGSGYLLKVGVKGKRIGREEQRKAHLTFVIDTSGSMDTKDRLGLARKSLKLLVNKLGPQDQVAIVQYSSQSRLLLDHTPASQRQKILKAIDALQVTGSTHLEQGLTMGYQVAAQAFDPKAVNRVLLISDGAANLGAATAEEILGQVESYRKQGIFCSIFGFGIGTYNDVMLETLANKGNGSYQFIDSEEEARRVFVDDLSATLNTIASDVKIQVEFNPARVAQYRQLGYENRQLTKQQFRDDTVDAGEVGSGQSVTALYELHLQGDPNLPVGTVRVRYRNLDTGEVEEITRPITAGEIKRTFEQADIRFRLAAAVSAFAEKLRGSPFTEHLEYRDIAGVLRPVAMELELDRYVQELSRLVQAASSLPRAAE